MKIYLGIDNVICKTDADSAEGYRNAQPYHERIEKMNELFDEGNEIYYISYRETRSGKNFTLLLFEQFKNWNCKYTSILLDIFPDYGKIILHNTKEPNEYFT